MPHTTVKLNRALTRLPPSELIPIRADYPELPLAPGGAAVTLSSLPGLDPTSSKRTHLRENSAQTNNLRAAPQASNPEVRVSALFHSHLGLQERALPE